MLSGVEACAQHINRCQQRYGATQSVGSSRALGNWSTVHRSALEIVNHSLEPGSKSSSSPSRKRFETVRDMEPQRLPMAQAIYKIVRHNGGWSIMHDGEFSAEYLTKEAAFEAVLGPASNAIKTGQAVTITVPASESGEPASGKR